MKTTKMSRVLSAFLLGLTCCFAQSRANNPNYRPLVLPSGESFPGSEAELLRMRDRADGDAIRKIREHAWDIFGGLIAGENPVWNTWYNKCDLHLGLGKCAYSSGPEKLWNQQVLQGLEIPVQTLTQLQLLLPEPPQAEPSQAKRETEAYSAQVATYRSALDEALQAIREHPQFASVLYNQEAADNILGNCLYPRDASSGVIPKNCPPAPSPPGKVAAFQRGAVVLKTVWQVISPTGGTIPVVYPPDLWNEIHSESGKSGDFKTHPVTIKVDDKPCTGDYPDGVAVPLSCFYHSKLLTNDDLKFTPPQLVRTVGQGTLQANSYLVLVAVHVTTKEIDDWVWATFWWNNKTKGDWHSNGRPNILGDPGAHYLMDTTLSGMTPLEQDGGPKICFNPFLETNPRIPNGIISNCLQCHSKAAFGTASKSVPQVTAYKLGVLGRDGQRLASGIHPIPEYFDNMVSTDFLWSIAGAMDPKTRQVMQDLMCFGDADTSCGKP